MHRKPLRKVGNRRLCARNNRYFTRQIGVDYVLFYFISLLLHNRKREEASKTRRARKTQGRVLGVRNRGLPQRNEVLRRLCAFIYSALIYRAYPTHRAYT